MQHIATSAQQGKKSTAANGSSDHPYVFHASKGVLENRGMTLAGIVENNSIKIGIAVSRPGDIFNRKKGRLIAAGRAVKKPFDTYNIPEEFENTPGKYFNMLATDLVAVKTEEIEQRIANKKHKG
jgi:hypothetical protein